MKEKITYKKFLLPSLLGILIFYLLPYLASFYYAFTSAKTGAFVGLDNYTRILGSASFSIASHNTLLFMLICVPLNIIIPFMLAYAIHKEGKKSFIVLAFMLPLVIPSGATVYFWRVLFGNYGFINKILISNGLETVNFFQSQATLYIVTLVFLMKNIGFNMVLFISGLGYIPKEYYELAKVEGCSKWYIMRRITFVYIVPTAFMTLLMSVINSFKIFREIYLLFGNYPYTSVYMLQHYVNNLFSQAALQSLSALSTMISLIVAVVVIVLYIGQRKLAKDF